MDGVWCGPHPHRHESQQRNTGTTTDFMISLPLLQSKTTEAPAFCFLGVRVAFASLSLLNQDVNGVPGRIAGNHVSRWGKTNSCRPSKTAIRRLTKCRRSSSDLQKLQRISWRFALSLHFPSNMPRTRCTFVTQVTKCDFSNHISCYFGIITEESKTLVQKLYFGCSLPIQ